MKEKEYNEIGFCLPINIVSILLLREVNVEN